MRGLKLNVKTNNRIKTNNHIKSSFGDSLLLGFFYVFILAFSLICVYPMVLLVMSSFADEGALVREGYKLIPSTFSLEAYKLVFSTDVIFNAYKVTIFTTVVGTLLSILCSSGLAYAMSSNGVGYKKQLAFFLYFTMLFNGGLVPTYILISKYLQLKDSIWVYILPSLINPWNVFLLRSFLNTIPDSINESARIDGANDAVILFKIVLPLSLPAIATVSLFYALAYWNEWFRAILYIEDPNLQSLQSIIMKVLRNVDFAGEISRQSGINTQSLTPAYTTRMATAVLTVGPIILLYPFLQKYFVKGVVVGAVKG